MLIFPTCCMIVTLQCIIYPKLRVTNLIETKELGCCTSVPEKHVKESSWKRRRGQSLGRIKERGVLV
jgi:hypothetical protein